MEKIKEIEILQKNILSININDDNNDIMIESDNENNTYINEDDFPNLKNKKKRRRNFKNKNELDIKKIKDTNKLDNICEIENIMGHKIEKKIINF